MNTLKIGFLVFLILFVSFSPVSRAAEASPAPSPSPKVESGCQIDLDCAPEGTCVKADGIHGSCIDKKER